MRYSRIISTFLLCAGTCSLIAQMTPSAPVKDFRLPRFGENGYTQWVLRGETGFFDNEEQVRVEGMALRVYSGNERMALELSLESPSAILPLEDNCAFSDSPIEIIGANFKITGVGWEWSGDTKEIVIYKNAVVQFNQSIAGAFAWTNGSLVEKDATKICSEQLLLRTTEDEYYFEFTGNVSAVSNQMDLNSQQLTALVDVPKGRGKAFNAAGPSELDSIRQINAIGKVVIEQGSRTVMADRAEFLPRDHVANLDGSASVQTQGAYISGEIIRTRLGELVVVGVEGATRAQMILAGAGGLGLQGASELSSETIVQADKITMREEEKENYFFFNNSVEAMSGGVQMRSSKMEIIAAKVDSSVGKHSGATQAQKSEKGSDLKVGTVEQMVAIGGVEIEQGGQIATGEKVIFYPTHERAHLSGNPRLTNGEAEVTGLTMELKPGFAFIRGDSHEPVLARLPGISDLGYKSNLPANAENSQLKNDTKPEDTVIKSIQLRMIEGLEQTHFCFLDNVEVTATNMIANCDRLDVITQDQVNSVMQEGVALELKQIEAHDNVVVTQIGRSATAQKAYIFPKEGKVVLEGQAVVIDDRGEVFGHRIIMNKGQRRAIVEGGGDGERARITLPELPAMDSSN